MGGVHPAGEHEVLPDEQAQLIAQLVEGIGLVDPAAPHAQHGGVALRGQPQPALVPPAVHPRGEGVRGYPVVSSTEQGHVVDLEGEAAALLPLHRLLQEPQAAEARAQGAAGERGLALAHAHLQGVQLLWAVTSRPPQVRELQVELVLDVVARHYQVGVRWVPLGIQQAHEHLAALQVPLQPKVQPDRRRG